MYVPRKARATYNLKQKSTQHVMCLTTQFTSYMLFIPITVIPWLDLYSTKLLTSLRTKTFV